MQNDEITQDVQLEQTDNTLEQTEETQNEQEKDWKAEAHKWRDKAFKLMKKDQPIIREEKPAQVDDSRLWDIAEMIQRGYTKADAEFIQKNGGSEALNDPNSYVSIAMRNVQEQRRAEQAASQTQSGAGQSEIERQYTPEQLKNMSSEELAKILPHAESY